MIECGYMEVGGWYVEVGVRTITEWGMGVHWTLHFACAAYSPQLSDVTLIDAVPDNLVT